MTPKHKQIVAFSPFECFFAAHLWPTVIKKGQVLIGLCPFIYLFTEQY